MTTTETTDTDIFKDLKPRGFFLNGEAMVARATMRDPDGRWRMHDKPRWRQPRVIGGKPIESVTLVQETNGKVQDSNHE